MAFARTLLPAVLCLALTGVPAALPHAAAAAPYDGQVGHESALFSVKATNNAAAQEFTVDGTRLSRVSVWLGSGAATGTVTAQVRRVREDAGSVIASTTLDLAALGGAGAGWVEFPLNATVTAGTTYHLFLQASTAESGPIAWYGTTRSVPGSLTSWNYDRAYWGGWHAYGSRLAFHVNPTGSERCGETEPCYVPASSLAARTSGLLTNRVAAEAVLPSFAVGASYVDGSNVLRLPSGRWRYLPDGASASVVVDADDPGALAQVEESRAWLAAGAVPGTTAERRAASQRALLSMRALLRPNGAFAAAWAPPWEYSWPRDGAFAAVAFAATGHDEEAYRILGYDALTQRADGTWEARTLLDGSGPPDARKWQLDANGWVPWATWQWYRAAPPGGRDERLRALYPMVRKAADHAARSLGPDGLPPASPDYWELDTTTANIGTAAPLLAGLNSAADLASGLGLGADAERWGRRPGGCRPRSPPPSPRWGTSGPSTASTAGTARWRSWRPRSTPPRPVSVKRWTPPTGRCCCRTAGSRPATTPPSAGVRTRGRPALPSSPSPGPVPVSRRRRARCSTGCCRNGTGWASSRKR